MSEPWAFEREPYRKELEVTILSTGEEEGRRFARLSDTLLYPEGGGQPSDRGLLNGVEVVDVQKVGGTPHHYLEQDVSPGPARLVLDWSRRYDHMQQHTAQHLLSAMAASRFGWETTSFHLGVTQCDVELGVAEIPPADLEALEEAVMAEVRRARSVRGRRVSRAELEALPVRSRGLPPGHEGEIRLVEIEGIDVNTCGGTHLSSTAEIESVRLLTTEPMRGGLRLHWLAGRRVRQRLAAHEVRAAKLRRLFETSEEDVVATAARRLDQLKESTRRNRDLERRLAEGAAQVLTARQDDLVVTQHFDGLGSGFLNQVGRHITTADHPGLALLTATDAGRSFFLIAAGGRCALQVQGIGLQVAAALGGRGGGSAKLFQGQAPTLGAIAEALEVLSAALASDRDPST